MVSSWREFLIPDTVAIEFSSLTTIWRISFFFQTFKFETTWQSRQCKNPTTTKGNHPMFQQEGITTYLWSYWEPNVTSCELTGHGLLWSVRYEVYIGLSSIHTVQSAIIVIIYRTTSITNNLEILRATDHWAHRIVYLIVFAVDKWSLWPWKLSIIEIYPINKACICHIMQFQFDQEKLRRVQCQCQVVSWSLSSLCRLL